jgi:hypothetical protein
MLAFPAARPQEHGEADIRTRLDFGRLASFECADAASEERMPNTTLYADPQFRNCRRQRIAARANRRRIRKDFTLNAKFTDAPSDDFGILNWVLPQFPCRSRAPWGERATPPAA